MPPGGGRGSTGAHMHIPTQASGDLHQRNGSRIIMSCTGAQRRNGRPREKDAERQRSIAAVAITAEITVATMADGKLLLS